MVPKEDIVIFGAGGLAKIVIDTIEKEEKYEIIGVLDKQGMADGFFSGYPVSGNDKRITERQVNSGIVAIGDNWLRYQVVSYILSVNKSFNFISTIHPMAQVARSANIGYGTAIMAGVIVNSDTTIGNHCMLNANSSVDHDNRIGDFVNFAPNSATAGGVEIGDYTAISIGANLIHYIKIGEHTVIGAGSTVINNIDSFVVAYGNPAKIIKNRKKGEKYL